MIPLSRQQWFDEGKRFHINADLLVSCNYYPLTIITILCRSYCRSRGKYYEAYKQSTNIIVLEPDVAEVFRDSAAVNEALRLLTKIAKSTAA